MCSDWLLVYSNVESLALCAVALSFVLCVLLLNRQGTLRRSLLSFCACGIFLRCNDVCDVPGILYDDISINCSEFFVLIGSWMFLYGTQHDLDFASCLGPAEGELTA